jgi:DNA-binding Lrp family transcriptional regulator
MVVELALRDLDHLGQLIRVDIARIPGVMNLETMLIMAEPVADEGWPDVGTSASALRTPWQEPPLA